MAVASVRPAARIPFRTGAGSPNEANVTKPSESLQDGVPRAALRRWRPPLRHLSLQGRGQTPAGQWIRRVCKKTAKKCSDGNLRGIDLARDASGPAPPPLPTGDFGSPTPLARGTEKGRPLALDDSPDGSA